MFAAPNPVLVTDFATPTGTTPIRYLKQFHAKYTPIADLQAKAKTEGIDGWARLFRNKVNAWGGQLPRTNTDLPSITRIHTHKPC